LLACRCRDRTLSAFNEQCPNAQPTPLTAAIIGFGSGTALAEATIRHGHMRNSPEAWPARSALHFFRHFDDANSALPRSLCA